MSSLLFASDNTAPVSPKIARAMLEVNEGSAAPYGQDPFTAGIGRHLERVFECAVAYAATGTGTAANALCLAVLTHPYKSILCHKRAHVLTSEGGAVEFFSAGARLVTSSSHPSKLTPADVDAVAGALSGVHAMPLASVSITQPTETGDLYSLEEISALAAAAHRYGARLHMDGARFANALVALGTSAAAMTWRAGVDALSFGATKNGALNAELAIFFDPTVGPELALRHKRAGQLTSKMRFVAAQVMAYLDGDHWLVNAAAANRNALRVAAALSMLPGVSFLAPVLTNQIFVTLDASSSAVLQSAGIRFRPWPDLAPDAYRLVLAYSEADSDMQRVEMACLKADAPPLSPVTSSHPPKV